MACEGLQIVKCKFQSNIPVSCSNESQYYSQFGTRNFLFIFVNKTIEQGYIYIYIQLCLEGSVLWQVFLHWGNAFDAVKFDKHLQMEWIDADRDTDTAAQIFPYTQRKSGCALKRQTRKQTDKTEWERERERERNQVFAAIFVVK